MAEARAVLGDAKSFATDMKRLVNQKEFSDVKFAIGPRRHTVFAHRCILSARCDVFRTMFSEHAQKNKDIDVPFVLSDVNHEVFLALMEFIYTNSIKLTPALATKMLTTSIEYGLDGLRETCVSYMLDYLSVDNAAAAIQAGTSLGQARLRDEALKFIEENTQPVLKSKGFCEISEPALIHILESDNLNVDETDIVDAVSAWATATTQSSGSKSKGSVAKNVVSHVRLALLSPDELSQVEERNEKEKLIPVEYIARAWKYHVVGGNSEDSLTRKRRGTKERASQNAMKKL